MTNMDWTRLVMASLYGAGLDTSSNGTCHDAVVAALRKAKADGMREAALVYENMNSAGAAGAPFVTAMLRERADKLTATD